MAKIASPPLPLYIERKPYFRRNPSILTKILLLGNLQGQGKPPQHQNLVQGRRRG
jgi:hypothetical protein